jgi:hypothetical protein
MITSMYVDEPLLSELRARRLLSHKTGLLKKIERTGDELLQMQQVADLFGPDQDRRWDVMERFVDSVERGDFGLRAYPDPQKFPGSVRRRLAVADLIEIKFDPGSEDPPAGKYFLRPSVSGVNMASAWWFWARRSVWIKWIAIQGWPMPPELVGVDRVQAAYDWLLPRAQEAHQQGNKLKLFDPAICEKCMRETGADDRHYRAAIKRLPAKLRRGRGDRDRT